MEIIANTGGLIGTWPLCWGTASGGPDRLTIKDWAKENYALKNHLGIRHIPLGTDGGGLLPDRVEGYNSILDLPKLIEDMMDVGFTIQEIEMYMGRNLFKTLRRCIG